VSGSPLPPPDPADRRPGTPAEPAGAASTPPSPPAQSSFPNTAPALPADVAEQLRFDRAAPARLRSSAVPEEVRAELADLWNGIVGEIFDEVRGLDRRTALRRSTVTRVLQRVSGRILRAEQVVIFAGTQRPLPTTSEPRHVAFAAVGGATTAAAEEVAAFGTAGTGATIAIAAAIVGEVFETYVAASARSHQYRKAHRPVDPATVMIDLAEAAGYGDATGRRATLSVTRGAARWLAHRIVRRTSARFARALVPVVGIGIGAAGSGWSLHRVNRLALRPPSAAEVEALTVDLAVDLTGERPDWPGPTSLGPG
jgi:hypothetical protein